MNCTGADYNLNRSRDALTRSLLEDGLIASDTLGLGLRTSTHGAVIDSRSRVANNLYYIGPMLRADHWECTPRKNCVSMPSAWRAISPRQLSDRALRHPARPIPPNAPGQSNATR